MSSSILLQGDTLFTLSQLDVLLFNLLHICITLSVHALQDYILQLDYCVALQVL